MKMRVHLRAGNLRPHKKRHAAGATVLFCVVALAADYAESDRPAAGEPRVNPTMYDTQDWVISTHDVRDYGALANDQGDDAKAFQDAIDACHTHGGGVIFAPSGKYIFRKKIHLKSGVTLRGEWKNPDEAQGSPTGTLFCVYYGREMADGDPFIRMSSSTGLKDLSVWYPEQNFNHPVPYATTIWQDGGALCEPRECDALQCLEGRCARAEA